MQADILQSISCDRSTPVPRPSTFPPSTSWSRQAFSLLGREERDFGAQRRADRAVLANAAHADSKSLVSSDRPIPPLAYARALQEQALTDRSFSPSAARSSTLLMLHMAIPTCCSPVADSSSPRSTRSRSWHKAWSTSDSLAKASLSISSSDGLCNTVSWLRPSLQSSSRRSSPPRQPVGADLAIFSIP